MTADQRQASRPHTSAVIIYFIGDPPENGQSYNHMRNSLSEITGEGNNNLKVTNGRIF